ncbi:MAG: histidine kinase dimerization/phosphoacceptor domain -containing protein [Deinococcota bacterium]
MSTEDNSSDHAQLQPNMQANVLHQAHQHLLNASPVGMAICDSQGSCLQVNAAFQQYLAKLEPKVTFSPTHPRPIGDLLPRAKAAIAHDLAVFWQDREQAPHRLRWQIGAHTCNLTASRLELATSSASTTSAASHATEQHVLLTVNTVDEVDTPNQARSAAHPDTRLDSKQSSDLNAGEEPKLAEPLVNAPLSQAELAAICASLPVDLLLVDDRGNYLAGHLSSYDNSVLSDELITQLVGHDGTDVFEAATAHILNKWQTRLFSSLEPQSFTLELKLRGHQTGPYCRVYMKLISATCGLVFIQDISTEHKLELSLETSQANLQAFYEASPDLIYRINRQGMYLDYHVPAHFVDMLKNHDAVQQNQQNVRGLYLPQLLEPELANPTLQHLDLALTTGNMQTFEGSLYMDNKRHYQESRMMPVSADEAMVFVRDVTSRKQAEQQLAQSERLFRSFFEDSPTPYLILLPDADNPHTSSTHVHHKLIRHVLVNHAFEDFLGYSQADADANNVQHFLKRISYPEDYALEQSLLTRSRQRGVSSYRLVKRYIRSNGDLLWADVTNIIIHNEQGRYLRTFCIVQDISDRIAAEDQLRDSREQLELAINAANLVVWDWHVGNNQFSSRGWFQHSTQLEQPIKFWGLDQLRAHIHPEDLSRYDQRLADCISGQHFTFTVEFRLALEQLTQELSHQADAASASARDQHWRWFSIIGSGVDYSSSGKPLRLSGVLQHIHERKLTETHLQDALTKLEQALNEKNVLLAEVHHRVKNNMQVLGSLLSLQGRSLTDAASKQVIQASQARVRAMADVHEVMYRSDRFSDLNVKAYVEKVSRTMQRALDARDVALSFNLQDVSITIQEAIPCGLVFNEMLSNAFKHAFSAASKPPQAAVQIDLYEGSTPHLDNSFEDGVMTRYTGSFGLAANLEPNQSSRRWVYLQVQDNGIGMSEDKPSNFGTFLVETLVEQLQGVLAVTSRLQQGTTVTLMFPNQYLGRHQNG